jgi:AcrR family transcriptional regulator
MIVDAAQEIIRDTGLAGLSAREIAKAIGYSPGTLYNAYANLDDIVLHVEARVLNDLLTTLRAVPRDGEPRANLQRIVAAYLAFTEANPRLWNLLFEHRLPADIPLPPWYQEKMDAILAEFRTGLEPVIGGTCPERLARATSVIWSSLHGITSLATAGKLRHVSLESGARIVDDLLTTYLAGFMASPRA